MNSPHDSEDGDVAESVIRDWIYIFMNTTIDLFGIEDAGAFTVRAMGDPMYERDTMILAYRGEILNWRTHWEQRDHVAVTERVTAWRSIIPVVQSHGPPVHPFNPEQRSLTTLDSASYVLADTPDDVPTLNAREYEQWLQMTVSKQQRRHDKEASKERDLRWHQMRQDRRHEPEDWVDFQRRKRDNEAQHHRDERDELTNTIYIDTAPAYEAASPASQPPTPAFAVGYPGWFGPPCRLAFPSRKRGFGSAGDSEDVVSILFSALFNNDNGVKPTFDITRTMRKIISRTVGRVVWAPFATLRSDKSAEALSYDWMMILLSNYHQEGLALCRRNDGDGSMNRNSKGLSSVYAE
ncbi:hypothetical protein EDD18DRAFT_1115656 [Armillaria luteobubalina]|uniref:Uncharacterized protein n=1 Tax=Armillaria luteobubalina TaxID=153913 RepID=A0AA39P1V4_9AGAR|nr:hypothetical protein EDD18DRAFT_1115656 [Armillaria luteobubalina]